MTPPRAGTFIYHTHWHDDSQLENALYGPLIVLEPKKEYDPEHDQSFVIGVGNYAPFGPMLLVNGTPKPIPLQLKTGTRYRMRLINITTNESDLRVRLISDERIAQWKIIARDGADLAPARQFPTPADMALTVGSTADVELQSDHETYVEMRVSARLFGAMVMLPITFKPAK